MKKIKYLLLILILIVGCGIKKLTLDDFVDKATFNGYIIKEDKDGYESYNKILNVYYAVNREGNYDIQFLELKDEEYAHQFFLHNMSLVKENITIGDYEKSQVTSNYDLYHAENDMKYYLIIRNYQNIIYIDAPIEYINEIEDFLKDLELEF